MPGRSTAAVSGSTGSPCGAECGVPDGEPVRLAAPARLRTGFRYLLVIHVPAALTPDGRLSIGDMWAEDLLAEVRAIRACGGRVVLASPLVPNLLAGASGNFSVATV